MSVGCASSSVAWITRSTEWTAWLDTRVPALKDNAPRQAARTSQGRERLEALLAAFDRNAEVGPPRAVQHLERIRLELGFLPRDA